MRIDCHNHLGVDLLFYLSGGFPYAQDVPTLIGDGERAGISHWIVFPMVSNLAFSPRGYLDGKLQPDGAIADTPYAFENRRMLAEIHRMFPDDSRKFIPFTMIDPERTPAAQARALRELREEYPFYGFKIQGTIIQARVRKLLSQGRVFLDLAREWNLPFLIHSSYAMNDPWSQSSDILDVAESNPDLRFCLAHSCRFEKSSLDRLASLPNCWFDCSAHGIHCEAAERRLPIIPPPSERFDSDYSRPDTVLADLAQAYPEKLLWGSDSPFYSYIGRTHDGGILSLRSSYARESEYLNALPPEARNRITSDNTLMFLNLPDEQLFT